MIPKFFGMPQEVVRLGIWAKLRPTEAKVYVGLWHESERYRTRELLRTDRDLQKLAGVSPRALRDARIKLQERGLVRYSGEPGAPYAYTLCDPATQQPWVGDPKQPIAYRKKDTTATEFPTSPVALPKSTTPPSSKPSTQPLENHGLSLKF